MPSSRKSRKRPYGGVHVPLDRARLAGLVHLETGPDGRSYQVQELSGGQRTYWCPGCQQAIAAGAVQVVVWPSDDIWGDQAGLDSRRHWHRSCWGRSLRPQ